MLLLTSEDEVLDLVPTALGNRAKDVFTGKKLKCIELHGPDLDTGNAICAGSMPGESYSVSFRFRHADSPSRSNKKSFGTAVSGKKESPHRAVGNCTCPSVTRSKDGLCKHVIALLLARVEQIADGSAFATPQASQEAASGGVAPTTAGGAEEPGNAGHLPSHKDASAAAAAGGGSFVGHFLDSVLGLSQAGPSDRPGEADGAGAAVDENRGPAGRESVLRAATSAQGTHAGAGSSGGRTKVVPSSAAEPRSPASEQLPAGPRRVLPAWMTAAPKDAVAKRGRAKATPSKEGEQTSGTARKRGAKGAAEGSAGRRAAKAGVPKARPRRSKPRPAGRGSRMGVEEGEDEVNDDVVEDEEEEEEEGDRVVLRELEAGNSDGSGATVDDDADRQHSSGGGSPSLQKERVVGSTSREPGRRRQTEGRKGQHAADSLQHVSLSNRGMTLDAGFAECTPAVAQEARNGQVQEDRGPGGEVHVPQEPAAGVDTAGRREKPSYRVSEQFETHPAQGGAAEGAGSPLAVQPGAGAAVELVLASFLPNPLPGTRSEPLGARSQEGGGSLQAAGQRPEMCSMALRGDLLGEMKESSATPSKPKKKMRIADLIAGI